MLIEFFMMALVVAYIGAVVLGHVLLVAAIYRCLREDYFGGRRKTTEARRTLSAHAKTPLPAQ
jgi:hypothetical protein